MSKRLHTSGADVRWLSFRLRNGQSIGPDKLQAGWNDAAAADGCSVRRERLDEGGVVYALYGPSTLNAPHAVELRMRRFLMDHGYVFSMGTMGAR